MMSTNTDLSLLVAEPNDPQYGDLQRLADVTEIAIELKLRGSSFSVPEYDDLKSRLEQADVLVLSKGAENAGHDVPRVVLAPAGKDFYFFLRYKRLPESNAPVLSIDANSFFNGNQLGAGILSVEVPGNNYVIHPTGELLSGVLEDRKYGSEARRVPFGVYKNRWLANWKCFTILGEDDKGDLAVGEEVKRVMPTCSTCSPLYLPDLTAKLQSRFGFNVVRIIDTNEQLSEGRKYFADPFGQIRNRPA